MKFEYDDIRRYKNLVVKIADIVLKKKNLFNDIEIVFKRSQKPQNHYGVIYFLTIDYKIVKYGGSSAGIKECLYWYSNMTASMQSGRIIPNFYIRDQLYAGKKAAVYVEYLEILTRNSKDIDTNEVFKKADVSYYKPREKE